MGFSSVVYAFVLLNLVVDGALAQKPNVMSKVQRPILGDHSQHLYGDTFCEKEGEWMPWTGGWEGGGTIVAGNVHGYGCSHYKEDVCATLSYELIDENADATGARVFGATAASRSSCVRAKRATKRCASAATKRRDTRFSIAPAATEAGATTALDPMMIRSSCSTAAGARLIPTGASRVSARRAFGPGKTATTRFSFSAPAATAFGATNA